MHRQVTLTNAFLITFLIWRIVNIMSFVVETAAANKNSPIPWLRNHRIEVRTQERRVSGERTLKIGPVYDKNLAAYSLGPTAY